MGNNVGAIILNEKGEILLQKKDSSYVPFPQKWCFFGGHIEEGETPEDTIVREVIEEIGIHLSFNFFKKLNWDNEAKDDLHIFSATFNGDPSKIRLGEGAGFAFFRKDEIASLNMIDINKKILLDYLKNKN